MQNAQVLKHTGAGEEISSNLTLIYFLDGYFWTFITTSDAGAWLEWVPRVPRVPRVPWHPQSCEIYHLAPAKVLRFSK